MDADRKEGLAMTLKTREDNAGQTLYSYDGFYWSDTPEQAWNLYQKMNDLERHEAVSVEIANEQT